MSLFTVSVSDNIERLYKLFWLLAYSTITKIKNFKPRFLFIFTNLIGSKRGYVKSTRCSGDSYCLTEEIFLI